MNNAVSFAADTPPVTLTDPRLKRYEYEMGYHSAVVELMPAIGAGPALWNVNVVSQLTGQLETLLYDDEELAKAGAQAYVKGLYNAEMALRDTFYQAYSTAYGRGSAPDTHGPSYVAPATV